MWDCFPKGVIFSRECTNLDKYDQVARQTRQRREMDKELTELKPCLCISDKL